MIEVVIINAVRSPIGRAGSALALGHPLGYSGAHVLTTLP
jgi:acetyl-CoA acetyltransferase